MGKDWETENGDRGDLWHILLGNLRLIIGVPILFAAIMAVGSLYMPNIYRGEALLSPVTLDEGAGFGLPGLEGFANLVGISMPSGGNADENLAVLRSRDFIWRFIRDQNLMPVLFEDKWGSANDRWLDDDPEKHPTLWDAYRLFTREMLTTTRDSKTGLVRVSIEWKDAALASLWTNEIISLLNQYLRTKAIERSESNLIYLNEALDGVQVAERRQTLYQLIEKEQRTAMIVNTQKEYAFRVIDPAVAPDRKVRPKRLLLVAMVGTLGFLLVTGFVLFRSDFQNIKKSH